MLAMAVNDNAGSLTPSGVLSTIASKLAPTGGLAVAVEMDMYTRKNEPQLPPPPRIHPKIHRQRSRYRLHLVKPPLWQKQQVTSLQRHSHEGHRCCLWKALVIWRVRVEVAAVQSTLGCGGPGAEGFAMVGGGEGEGFLAPDLGEQVVGVVAVQWRQGALGADPDSWGMNNEGSK